MKRTANLSVVDEEENRRKRKKKKKVTITYVVLVNGAEADDAYLNCC